MPDAVTSFEVVQTIGAAEYLPLAAGLDPAQAPTVVFVSENDARVGAESRAMAVARRAATDITPILFTVQHAAGGLTEVLRRTHPALVVVDHPDPPHDLLAAAWEVGVETLWLTSGAPHPPALEFDHVVVAMDLVLDSAEDHVLGPKSHVVAPVCPVTAADMASTEDARRSLGLSPRDRVALVNLSEGAVDAPLMSHVRDVIRAKCPGATLFVPIGHDIVESPRIPDVVFGVARPLARYLHAFDAAISVAGYRDFHDLVLAAVPTIWVAIDGVGADRAIVRGKVGAHQGLGLFSPNVWCADFELAVGSVFDVAVSRRLRSAAVAAHIGDGTEDAARVIASIALGRSPI